jgi:hypothetical protein
LEVEDLKPENAWHVCSSKVPKGRFDCFTKSLIGYAEWLQFLLHFETQDLNFSFLQSGQWAAFSFSFHAHTYIRKSFE